MVTCQRMGTGAADMVMEEDGADLGKGNGGDNGNKAILMEWNSNDRY